jgi:uncharacterized protein
MKRRSMITLNVNLLNIVILPLFHLFVKLTLIAYKRFIGPAIEREIRNELTEKADEQAIAIFGENLRNLLLQPPLKGKIVLGFDPAYRTGCKLAVIDETGKVLAIEVIYPHKPASNEKRASSCPRIATVN